MKPDFRGTPQLSCCPAQPLSQGPAPLLGMLLGRSATRPAPHVRTAECCCSAGDAHMDQPSPKRCPSPSRCTHSSTDPLGIQQRRHNKNRRVIESFSLAKSCEPLEPNACTAPNHSCRCRIHSGMPGSHCPTRRGSSTPPQPRSSLSSAK